MEFFPYGSKEIQWLQANDPKLGELIDEVGVIKREIIPDPFSALVSSIVSQQISGKAAKTVWARLCSLVGDISPGKLDECDIIDIQQCGMSLRKAEYIKGIARAALDGQVDFKTLHLLDDKEIISKLSALRGVGVWTAEMLLIFSLCRLDVVSFHDLGIRRGMERLYGFSELKKEDFLRIRAGYSPYGSVASLYLWEMAGK